MAVGINVAPGYEVKKKRENKHIATTILGVSAIGFLASYPFHASFVGGLISSGFIASMVGGCADWFAVTALFRKPLGIPWKTELIPKNREKIFTALTDMVGNELLSPQNIKSKLASYDYSKLFLSYLDSESGTAGIQKMLRSVISRAVEQMDVQKASKQVGEFVRENLRAFQLSPLLISAIRVSLESGYDEDVCDCAVDILKKVLDYPQFTILLEELVGETKHIYKGKKLQRAVADYVVLDLILGLSNEKIAEIIKSKIVAYLDENKTHNTAGRQELRRQIWEKSALLETDAVLIGKVEAFKDHWIDNHAGIDRKVSIFLEQVKEADDKGLASLDDLMDWFTERVNSLVARVRQDAALRESLNSFVLQTIFFAVDSYHGEIARMVRDGLESMTNDQLVELIESRAGNDLQMVRINGSVVGGLAGMILYLLTFWIK
jgi:uncharacterized membrane-anchored protein YjiN (DUF445 family)